MRFLKIFRLLCVVAAAVVVLACTDHAAAKREYFERGNRYFADNQIPKAIEAYRAALRQDPRFGEARLKLADAYARSEPTQGNALREYVRAADLLPDNIDAQLKAGGYLLFAQRFEDAKARADRVLKADPKNVGALILRANATAGLKDVPGAIREIEEALALHADDRMYTALGMLHATQQQRDDAEAAFRKAIDINPGSIAARLAMANFYWSFGKPAEAEAAVAAALKISPTDTAANRMLASLYMVTGRAAAAEAPLKLLAGNGEPSFTLMLADYYIAMHRAADAVPLLESLGKDKRFAAPSAIRLTRIDYDAGRRDVARRRIGDLLRAEPRNASAWTLKSRMLLGENDVNAALASARTATQTDSSSAEAHYAVGLAEAALHHVDEAKKAFTEVLRLNPRAVDAQLRLSTLQLASGETSAAVATATQANTIAPSNPDTSYALARSLIAQGNIDEAEPRVRFLVQRYPQAAATHVIEGLLALARNNLEPARAAFTRALERDPNSVDALEGLLFVDAKTKNLSAAVSRIEQRTAAAPSNASLQLIAAQTYTAAGRLDNAERALRRVIDTSPENLSAYSSLGRLYLRERRLDEALAQFDAAAKRNPGAVGPSTMAGIILELQNKPADARKRYEAIVAANSRAAVAANNLAWIYAQSGSNLDTALQLAQTAKSQMPDSPEVADTLGWVYYKRDVLDLAVESLEQSVAKDPKNATYHLHLGLAYAKAGLRTKAQSALERALQLDPNVESAGDARRALADLRS